MSVNVIWDDEAKTIIRQVYSGNTILDDYYLAVDEFVKLATSVEHTVHSIMDRTQVTSAPATMLQAIRYGNKKMPDNIGLRIILKPTIMTQIFVNIAKRVAPVLAVNIHFVDTLEEAYTLIKENEATQSS